MDADTLTTLHDLSKLQGEYAARGEQERLRALREDFRTVLRLGERILELEQRRKYLSARDQLGELKDLDDSIKALAQRRDFYDEKYETSRFEQMVALDDYDNRHDQLLKNLLEGDKTSLEEERRMREEEARRRQLELDQEFEAGEEEEGREEWWRQQHELDRLEQEEDKKERKPVVEKARKEKPEGEEDYKFKNPYVYNQGDADMEKYIRPLLNEFAGEGIADPELLRKYEQLEYLDVLGAKIWISAHS